MLVVVKLEDNEEIDDVIEEFIVDIIEIGSSSVVSLISVRIVRFSEKISFENKEETTASIAVDFPLSNGPDRISIGTSEPESTNGAVSIKEFRLPVIHFEEKNRKIIYLRTFPNLNKKVFL